MAKKGKKMNGAVSKKEENLAKKIAKKIAKQLAKAERNHSKMLKLRKKVNKQLKKVAPIFSKVDPKTKVGKKLLPELKEQAKILSTSV